jgi:hypothetical protein
MIFSLNVCRSRADITLADAEPMRETRRAG